MAIATPPFDPTPILADAYEDAFRKLVDRLVEDRLLRAGVDPNGLNIDALLGEFTVPTGRSLVAKSSPLKVEFPASPGIPGPAWNGAYLLWIDAFVVTAPVGAPITVQVKKYKGGSYSNVCQTFDLLTIPDGGNWARLGVERLFDYAVAPNDIFVLDVQGVGSSTKGDLLTVTLWWLAPLLKRRGQG